MRTKTKWAREPTAARPPQVGDVLVKTCHHNQGLEVTVLKVTPLSVTVKPRRSCRQCWQKPWTVRREELFSTYTHRDGMTVARPAGSCPTKSSSTTQGQTVGLPTGRPP